MKDYEEELLAKFTGLLEHVIQNREYYELKEEDEVWELFHEIHAYDVRTKGHGYELVQEEIDDVIQWQLEHAENLVSKFEIIKVCFDILDECRFNPELYYCKRKEVYLHILEQVKKFEYVADKGDGITSFHDNHYYMYPDDYDRIPAIMPTRLIKLMIYRDFVKLYKDEAYADLYVNTYKNLVWASYSYLPINRFEDAFSYFNIITVEQVMEDYGAIANNNYSSILAEMNTVYGYNLAAKSLYDESNAKSDLNKVIAYLQKAIELEKEDPILRINLAAVKIKMFDIAGAVQALISIHEERLKFRSRERQLDCFMTQEEIMDLISYLWSLNTSNSSLNKLLFVSSAIRIYKVDLTRRNKPENKLVDRFYNYPATKLDKEERHVRDVNNRIDTCDEWCERSYDGCVGSSDPLYWIRMEEGE